MPVKLYNLSGLPDQPMRRLLTRAMRLAGARGGVVVKVTPGGYRSGCQAYHYDFLCGSFLGLKQRKRYVRTNAGCVVMRPMHCPDTLQSAEQFFKSAVHEFAHVREFQQGAPYIGNLPWSRRGSNGRRPRWGRRPEEIRAVNATDDAMEKVDRRRRRGHGFDDEIIELALQMEARWYPERQRKGASA